MRNNTNEFDVELSELFADTVAYLTKRKRRWLSGRYVNCTWGKHNFTEIDLDSLLFSCARLVLENRMALSLFMSC